MLFLREKYACKLRKMKKAYEGYYQRVIEILNHLYKNKKTSCKEKLSTNRIYF